MTPLISSKDLKDNLDYAVVAGLCTEDQARWIEDLPAGVVFEAIRGEAQHNDRFGAALQEVLDAATMNLAEQLEES